MQHTISLFLIVSFVLLLTACGPKEPARIDGKLAVTVSIIPQKWLVEQIAGDLVNVNVIVQPGEGPETFQPSDKQVSRVMQSAVFFRMKLPFERGAWFDAIAESKRLRVVDVTAGITRREMQEHVHHDEPADAHAGHDHHGHDHSHHDLDHHAHDDHDAGDPHVWTTPALLKVQAGYVTQTLIELDPQNAKTYQANHDWLLGELDAADTKIKSILEPHKGKAFFIFHPSWGYFADRYNLNQVAIEIGGKNPSDKDLTRLQREAREQKIGVVFVQPQNAGAAATAIANAIDGKVQTIDPLAENVLENLVHVATVIAESFEKK